VVVVVVCKTNTLLFFPRHFTKIHVVVQAVFLHSALERMWQVSYMRR
jgi:hypothetical protein